MRMEQSEAQFQQAVTQLAAMNGWDWFHVQPGLTDRGRYRSPVSGTMGAGWPDLVMVKAGRIIFVELKAQRGQMTANQKRVLYILAGVGEVFVWRPSDWSLILEVLGGGQGEPRQVSENGPVPARAPVR